MQNYLDISFDLSFISTFRFSATCDSIFSSILSTIIYSFQIFPLFSISFFYHLKDETLLPFQEVIFFRSQACPECWRILRARNVHRHLLRDFSLQAVPSSTRLSSLALFNASSCPAATSTEASKLKSFLRSRSRQWRRIRLSRAHLCRLRRAVITAARSTCT